MLGSVGRDVSRLLQSGESDEFRVTWQNSLVKVRKVRKVRKDVTETEAGLGQGAEKCSRVRTTGN